MLPLILEVCGYLENIASTRLWRILCPYNIIMMFYITKLILCAIKVGSIYVCLEILPHYHFTGDLLTGILTPVDKLLSEPVMTDLCVSWHRSVNVDTNVTENKYLMITCEKWIRIVVSYECGNGEAWWRHQMETLSALLVICAGNSGEFSAQRPVTRSFGVFFDLQVFIRWDCLINNFEWVIRDTDVGGKDISVCICLLIFLRQWNMWHLELGLSSQTRPPRLYYTYILLDHANNSRAVIHV